MGRCRLVVIRVFSNLLELKVLSRCKYLYILVLIIGICNLVYLYSINITNFSYEGGKEKGLFEGEGRAEFTGSHLYTVSIFTAPHTV